MNLMLTRGDFRIFGTVVEMGKAIFTFDAGGAKDVTLCLYEMIEGQVGKEHQILLTPALAIGNVYSVMVEGFDWANTAYLFMLDGTYVVDPYAQRIIGREVWNDELRWQKKYRVYGGFSTESYQWKHDNCDRLASENTMIYKLHMRGYTMNHGMRQEKQGSYLGVLDHLQQLQKLGITTLEFQPIYEFEEMIYDTKQRVTSNREVTMERQESHKVNYWGYGDGNYFAPKASYFGGNDPINAMKSMVDAIHEQQMECIMEISFSNEYFKEYMIQALRFWVREFHIDGFHLVGINFPMESILDDPYLAATRLYAEQFPQEALEREKRNVDKRLFIYNDEFLYALRKLENHMDGNLEQLFNQMRRQNVSYGFVNYAANTTGFTLYDSFAYGEKHNEDNGEENADGNNYNCSCNYGIEGTTRNKEIEQMRYQQMRNAFATLLISQGTPLILAGDERGNSQQGNNNPYCQDNTVGWVQYGRSKRALGLEQFVMEMSQFRRAHPMLHTTQPVRMNDYQHMGCPDVSLHGEEPWIGGIGPEKRCIGIMYAGAYEHTGEKQDIYIALNYQYEASTLALPKLTGQKRWCLIMNTAMDDGAFAKRMIALENQQTIEVPGQSISILLGEVIEES